MKIFHCFIFHTTTYNIMFFRRSDMSNIRSDWRGEDFKMSDLISRLQNTKASDALAPDVTFELPDGSQLQAHKFILALASPVFQAQFFGVFAEQANINVVQVTDLDSLAFRRFIDCIYKSSTDHMDDWSIDSSEFWNLLKVAHFYLVQHIVEFCNDALIDPMEFLKVHDSEDLEEFIDITNKASELSIYDEIYTDGRESVVCVLGKVVHEDYWSKLQENVKNKILVDLDTYIWEGGCEACIKLIRMIKMNKFNAPGLLNVCYSYLGKHTNLNHRNMDAFIKFLTEEKRLSESELMDFTKLIQKMTWEEVCGFGMREILDFLESRSFVNIEKCDHKGDISATLGFYRRGVYCMFPEQN